MRNQRVFMVINFIMIRKYISLISFCFYFFDMESRHVSCLFANSANLTYIKGFSLQNWSNIKRSHIIRVPSSKPTSIKMSTAPTKIIKMGISQIRDYLFHLQHLKEIMLAMSILFANWQQRDLHLIAYCLSIYVH